MTEPRENTLGRRTFRPDLSASVVVFLVALPLCTGVAVASGVPPALGIITGIVGGLVTGLLPGSSLQVSGPAAGLTVLTLELVREHGLGGLATVVLGAGLLQILFGMLKIGRWFQGISTGVVQGMLAGIGAVLVFGQLYPAVDGVAPGDVLENVTGLGSQFGELTSAGGLAAGFVAVLTLAVVACWPRLPAVSKIIPASLAGVVVAIGVTGLVDLPVRRLVVGSLFDAVQPAGLSGLGGLADPGLLASVVIFALVASAESLFSASAVDRMHDGPRTRYDAELIAQGVGNTVCGLLGALPMTAVIVRSSANIAAGARTKASRVLHGVWLLVFVVAVPQLLSLVPTAALAALLVHAGWKLLSPRKIRALWSDSRGETLVLAITTAAIIATTLFEGVLIGLIAALAKTAWQLSRLSSALTSDAVTARLVLRGNATFLAVPRLGRALESVPAVAEVTIDCSGLRHCDRAARETIEAWVALRRAQGAEVAVLQDAAPELPIPAGAG